MRILFLSSVFPQPYDPTRGIYAYQLCNALANRHEVKAVAPWPWTDSLRFRRSAAKQEQQQSEVIEVLRPRYYYVPGMLRGTHAGCMWGSIRRRVRKLAK